MGAQVSPLQAAKTQSPFSMPMGGGCLPLPGSPTRWQPIALQHSHVLGGLLPKKGSPGTRSDPASVQVQHLRVQNVFSSRVTCCLLSGCS